ncbi:SphA family protein [Pseudomonas pergaminensis]
MLNRQAMVAAVVLAGSLMEVPNAHAVEGAAGVYLLGMKNPGAGILPAEGVYYQNDIYLYRGTLGGEHELPTGGRLAAGIDATALVNLSTLLWSTPWQLGGGRVGLNVTLPIGYKKLEAQVQAQGPFGGPGVSRPRTDDIATVGDPTVGGSLAWSEGKFHWQTGLSVNVPAGDYREGRLANLAYNRWGVDTSTSGTWLDTENGRDLSASAGVTFNGRNDATRYQSGNELHLEWSATQYLSPQQSVGLIGYHYRQLTGDSGAGALLGDFKGRATALGASTSYTFSGKRPVTVRLKYFHELSVQNRASSDSLFITFAFALTSG